MPRLPLVLVVALMAACTGAGRQEGPAPAASGPPEIDYEVVRRHAQQFDVDLPSRPAGSQEELAAATYILGHLQLAGYSPVLDAVPVSNQVQSSNVIALPPSGDDPDVLVTVDYATGGGHEAQGGHIGLFLELARAMRVARPPRKVGFVALGAESFGDERRSRALSGFLAESGLRPTIISIGRRVDPGDDPLVAANFERDFISGPVRSAGTDLMTRLLDPHS